MYGLIPRSNHVHPSRPGQRDTSCGRCPKKLKDNAWGFWLSAQERGLCLANNRLGSFGVQMVKTNTFITLWGEYIPIIEMSSTWSISVWMENFNATRAIWPRKMTLERWSSWWWWWLPRGYRGSLSICGGYGISMRGEGNQSNYVVEAFLAYWLSWYIFSSGSEGDLNQHIFPLAMEIAKGMKFALVPLFGHLLCEVGCIKGEVILTLQQVDACWLYLPPNLFIGEGHRWLWS